MALSVPEQQRRNDDWPPSSSTTPAASTAPERHRTVARAAANVCACARLDSAIQQIQMSALGRFKADVCGILAVFLPGERLEVEAWLFVACSGMA
jgi:hypothetical protein